MATRAKKPARADIREPEHDPKRLARLAASPTVRGAVMGAKYAAKLFGELDQQEYFDRLGANAKAVQNGDLSMSKAMLASQANTLDLLFNGLIRRAIDAEYVNQMETYLRLALKAQAQAAHTVKVLGELENPKSVAFVRQQTNISSDGGPQQVNVGPPPCAPAREETVKSSNELLEQSYGEWLDAGAAGQTGRGNTALEAVGTVNRPQE